MIQSVYPVCKTLSPTVRISQVSRVIQPSQMKPRPRVLIRTQTDHASRVEIYMPETKLSDQCLVTPVKQLQETKEANDEAYKKVQYLEQRVWMLEDALSVIRSNNPRVQGATPKDNTIRNNLLKQSNFSEMSKSANNWRTGEQGNSARINETGAADRQLNQIQLSHLKEKDEMHTKYECQLKELREINEELMNQLDTLNKKLNQTEKQSKRSGKSGQQVMDLDINKNRIDNQNERVLSRNDLFAGQINILDQKEESQGSNYKDLQGNMGLEEGQKNDKQTSLPYRESFGKNYKDQDVKNMQTTSSFNFLQQEHPTGAKGYDLNDEIPQQRTSQKQKVKIQQNLPPSEIISCLEQQVEQLSRALDEKELILKDKQQLIDQLNGFKPNPFTKNEQDGNQQIDIKSNLISQEKSKKQNVQFQKNDTLEQDMIAQQDKHIEEQETLIADQKLRIVAQQQQISDQIQKIDDLETKLQEQAMRETSEQQLQAQKALQQQRQMQDFMSQINKLNNQIQELTSSNSELSQKLADQIEQSRRQKSSFQQELQKIQKAEGQVSSQYQEKVDEVEHKKMLIDQLEQQISDFQKRIQEKKESFDKDIKLKNQQFEESQTQLQESLNKIQELESQLSQLNFKLNQAEKKQADQQALFQVQRQNLENQLLGVQQSDQGLQTKLQMEDLRLALQQKQHEAQSIREECQQYRVKSEQLEQQITDLQEQLQEERQAQIQSQKQYEVNYKNLQGQIKGFSLQQEQKIEEIQSQLIAKTKELEESLQINVKAQQIIKDDRDLHEQKIQKLQSELKAQFRQVEQLQKEKQEQINKILDLEENSKERSLQLKDKEKSIRDREEAFNAMKLQNVNLLQEIDIISQQNQSLTKSQQKEKASFDEIKSQFENQNRQSLQKLEQLQDKLLEKEAQICDCKNENQDLKEKLLESNKQIKLFQDKFSKQQEENNRQKQELDEVNEHLNSSLQHVTKELEQLKKSFRTNQIQKSKTQDQLNSLIDIKTHLESQHQDLKDQYTELLMKLEESVQQQQNLEIMLKRKDDQHIQIQGELELWMKSHQDLEQEASLLQQQNDNLLEEIRRHQTMSRISKEPSKEELQLQLVKLKTDLSRVNTKLDEIGPTSSFRENFAQKKRNN